MAADATPRRRRAGPRRRPAAPSTTRRGPPIVALRVRCLRQLQAAMRAHADELRAMTIAETGSPLFMTRSAQLDEPVAALGWVADLAESYAVDDGPGHGRAPGDAGPALGACASPPAWWPPSRRGTCPIRSTWPSSGPALAAGNTVVLKPAPDTPWCATVLGRLIAEETDIPAGVVNILPSSDPAFGARLVHRRPRRPGQLHGLDRHRAQGDGRRRPAPLKRVFLELGGKSAFVVLDDADLRAACGVAAFTVCTHAGQGCAITTRLVVPRSRFDEAVDVARPPRSPSCPPVTRTDPGTICGPLINARQRDRVEGYIAHGPRGGRRDRGGRRPSRRPAQGVLRGADARRRDRQRFPRGARRDLRPRPGRHPPRRGRRRRRHRQRLPLRVVGLGVVGATATGPWPWPAGCARGPWGSTAASGTAPTCPSAGTSSRGSGREMGVAGFEEYLETKVVAEPA